MGDRLLPAGTGLPQMLEPEKGELVVSSPSRVCALMLMSAFMGMAMAAGSATALEITLFATWLTWGQWNAAV